MTTIVYSRQIIVMREGTQSILLVSHKDWPYKMTILITNRTWMYAEYLCRIAISGWDYIIKFSEDACLSLSFLVKIIFNLYGKIINKTIMSWHQKTSWDMNVHRWPFQTKWYWIFFFIQIYLPQQIRIKTSRITFNILEFGHRNWG